MKYHCLFIFVFCIVFLPLVSAASTMLYDINPHNPEDRVISMPGTIYSQTVLFQVESSDVSTCKYSAVKGNSYQNMEHVFDLNFETVHQKTLTNLFDGVHRFYVRCRHSEGNVSGEVEVSFKTNSLISASIDLSEESPFSEGLFDIVLTTSKIASQTPLLTYSYDGINYNPIPLYGSGTQWNGYLIIGDTPREDVGSFKFQGRDLENNLGTEITEGGVFVVDTIRPELVADVSAEGRQNSILLKWFSDDSDIEEYRIFRSSEPGVEFSDFHSSTSTKTYTDTSLERGKTYYYRVSAVDEAGNEGPLSSEVFATVLLSNTSTVQNGLETRFHGLVDNFLAEVDLLLEDISDSSSLSSQNAKEQQLFTDLKLGRDVDNARSEIESLRREVENYKSQTLSKTELDKRLNSAQLKLTTIKRRIPDSLIIVSEKTVEGMFDENDVRSTILATRPEINLDTLELSIQSSLSTMDSSGFSVQTSGYNLEVVHIDGTRKKMAFVSHDISSTIQPNENISLVESVPSGIASSVSELDIKNADYSVLKENVIIGFALTEQSIQYSLDNHISLDALSDISTLLIYEESDKVSQPLFTGYFSFIDFEGGGNYFGIFVIGVLVIGLAGYLFITRRTVALSESLLPLRRTVHFAHHLLESGNISEAQRVYHQLSSHYNRLGKREKKIMFPLLVDLHQKIEGGKTWFANQ